MSVLIQPLRQASEVCIVSTFIVFIKEKISGEDGQMVQKKTGLHVRPIPGIQTAQCACKSLRLESLFHHILYLKGSYSVFLSIK